MSIHPCYKLTAAYQLATAIEESHATEIPSLEHQFHNVLKTRANQRNMGSNLL